MHHSKLSCIWHPRRFWYDGMIYCTFIWDCWLGKNYSSTVNFPITITNSICKYQFLYLKMYFRLILKENSAMFDHKTNQISHQFWDVSVIGIGLKLYLWDPGVFVRSDTNRLRYVGKIHMQCYVQEREITKK